MKKIIYLFIFLLTFLITSCTVNDTTGKIHIVNESVVDLTNVRIGNRLIVAYVASGGYYDYWYYKNIEGKLTTEGVLVKETQEEWNVTLKPGYWVYITAAYDAQLGDDYVTIEVYEDSTLPLGTEEWVEE